MHRSRRGSARSRRNPSNARAPPWWCHADHDPAPCPPGPNKAGMASRHASRRADQASSDSDT
ncbi:MAG: hypothetical protein ACK56I_16720 [bacterium]